MWRTVIWSRPTGMQAKAPAHLAELFENLKWLQSMNKDENLRLYVRAKLRALDAKMGYYVPFAAAEPIIMNEVNVLIKNSYMIGQWGETLCTRMRRCLTKTGYLGHVPRNAKSGDQICNCWGSDTICGESERWWVCSGGQVLSAWVYGGRGIDYAGFKSPRCSFSMK